MQSDSQDPEQGRKTQGSASSLAKRNLQESPGELHTDKIPRSESPAKGWDHRASQNMRISLFAIADSVIVNSKTNRVSLLNVIDELSAPNFPAVHPLLNIVVVLEREEAETDKLVGSLVFDFKGQELFTTNINFEFQDKLRSRGIIALQGLTFRLTRSSSRHVQAQKTKGGMVHSSQAVIAARSRSPCLRTNRVDS